MKYFTIAEIAEVLTVHAETVRRWTRLGEPRLEVNATNRGHLISEDDLRRFLTARNYDYDRSPFPVLAREKEDLPVVPSIIGTATLGSNSLSAALTSGLGAVAKMAVPYAAVVAARHLTNKMSTRIEASSSATDQADETVSTRASRNVTNQVGETITFAVSEDLYGAVRLLVEEVEQLRLRVQALERQREGVS